MRAPAPAPAATALMRAALRAVPPARRPAAARVGEATYRWALAQPVDPDHTAKEHDDIAVACAVDAILRAAG